VKSKKNIKEQHVATTLGVNLGEKQKEQHEATILGVYLGGKQKRTKKNNL
jgi:hypothetical protein